MLEPSAINTDTIMSFIHSVLDNKYIVSFCLITLIMLVKYSMISVIKRRGKNNRRVRINLVNNVITVVVILVLFNLWSEEIQKFAFSIAAFIVAIVLATREFIQCFIGNGKSFFHGC